MCSRMLMGRFLCAKCLETGDSLQHLPFSPATNPLYPGRLVAGDTFPGRLVAGDTFPGRYVARDKSNGKARRGYLPGRHRGAHIVSVKQIIATVEGFPGRHVAQDTNFIK
ncbi:hypothetical protein Tco_1068523 [Tanacetum coccineum]|uniref:Uncharacterized protein n=1 Tax=Tanacetum coccineum TaxID=301880 RepID=A0ABQ5HFZ4_9ASTR